MPVCITELTQSQVSLSTETPEHAQHTCTTASRYCGSHCRQWLGQKGFTARQDELCIVVVDTMSTPFIGGGARR